MPFPSDEAMPGSFEGPKISRRTTTRMIQCQGARIPSIMYYIRSAREDPQPLYAATIMCGPAGFTHRGAL
jgi:hypothetical protein